MWQMLAFEKETLDGYVYRKTERAKVLAISISLFPRVHFRYGIAVLLLVNIEKLTSC
jgi:hypothetical protein